jgi:RNA polymerase primary sigma factor
MSADKKKTVKKAVKKAPAKKVVAKKKASSTTKKVPVAKKAPVSKKAPTKKTAATKKKTAPAKKEVAKVKKTPAKKITQADTEKAIEEAAAKLPKKRKLSVKAQEKLNERIRNLIRLSKEQGFLTYKDINKALPDNVNNPDEIENVI